MGIALYDPRQHHTALYGEDPGVMSLSFAAWARSLLGCPDQVLRSIRDALTLTPALSHPLCRGGVPGASNVLVAASGYSICPC